MYLHGAAFSPTKDTFLKAIDKNFFLGWPGLSANLIKKHLHPSSATAAGRRKQERYGLRSIKHSNQIATATTSTSLDEDHFPPFNPNYTKTHDVCFALLPTIDKAFMDMTGRFPYKSSRGSEYILIAYH